MSQIRQRRRARRRPAFTIVEIIVVVAIIAVLISLSAAAIFRAIPSQQLSSTRTVISQIDTELQKQWNTTTNNYTKEPINSYTPGDVYSFYPTAQSWANGNNDLARVIWVKFRQKQNYPTSFAEASNPAPLPPDPYFVRQLTQLGYSIPYNGAPQPWESSACLLMALSRGTNGGGLPPEMLGSGTVKTYTTPNGKTVQGLVDGWGNPIVFCRWPVFSTYLNPNGAPQAGNKNDPVDPSGLLISTTWQATGGYTNFQNALHPVPKHTGTAMTYRVYPLIVSAGPDQALGLNPANFLQTTNASQAADDVYPVLGNFQ